MLLIEPIVIIVALAAPMAAIYLRRSTAIASVAAFILALAMCDGAACSATFISLLFVIFILSADIAEPCKGAIEGQQAVLDDDGRTFAEIAEERERG